MRNVTFGKKVSIVGVCAVLAMAEVMPVAAAESGTLLASGVLQSAGVGSVLNNSLTAEEYIAIAHRLREQAGDIRIWELLMWIPGI